MGLLRRLRKRATHRGQVIEYIEVTKDDIALATQLAHEVLGRTLDEMPPQTRKLLLLIQAMVREMAGRQQCLTGEVRFTRRDIRASTGWSDSQLKNHCVRLVEMEYLLLHGGSRGHLLHYELLWDGDNTQVPHLCGLPDVDGLINAASKTEGSERKSAPDDGRSGVSQGQVCPLSGTEQTASGLVAQGLKEISGTETENAVNSDKTKTSPHPTTRPHPDSAHAAAVTHG